MHEHNKDNNQVRLRMYAKHNHMNIKFKELPGQRDYDVGGCGLLLPYWLRFEK